MEKTAKMRPNTNIANGGITGNDSESFLSYGIITEEQNAAKTDNG